MNIELTAPSSWKELTESQLIYISWLLTTRALSKEELRAHAFVRLTGLTVITRHNGLWVCEFKKQRFILQPEAVTSFCRKFSFLTDGITEITPLVEMADQACVDIRMRGIPLKQYLACENYYQAFVFTQQESFLNYLCACFYTDREKFNDNETAERAKEFEEIPFHIRYTVFLWYFGLKGVLSKSFPNFFRKAEELDEDEPATAPDMRKVMNNMVRALTGGDVTKLHAVYNTETWDALAELDAKALEYAEYEKRMNKLKK